MTDAIEKEEKNEIEKAQVQDPGLASFRTYKKFCFLNNIPSAVRTAVGVSVVTLLTDKDSELYKAVNSDGNDDEKENGVIAAGMKYTEVYKADKSRAEEIYIFPNVMLTEDETKRINDSEIILGSFVSGDGSTDDVHPPYDGCWSKTLFSAAVKLICDNVITGDGEFEAKCSVFFKYLFAYNGHSCPPRRRKRLRDFI